MRYLVYITYIAKTALKTRIFTPPHATAPPRTQPQIKKVGFKPTFFIRIFIKLKCKIAAILNYFITPFFKMIFAYTASSPVAITAYAF